MKFFNKDWENYHYSGGTLQSYSVKSHSQIVAKGLCASSAQTHDEQQRDKLISGLKAKQLLVPDGVPEAMLLRLQT